MPINKFELTTLNGKMLVFNPIKIYRYKQCAIYNTDLQALTPKKHHMFTNLIFSECKGTDYFLIALE